MVPNRTVSAYQAVAVPVVWFTTSTPIHVWWIKGPVRDMAAVAAVAAALAALARPLSIKVVSVTAATGTLYWALKGVTFLIIGLSAGNTNRAVWTGLVVYLGLAAHVALYWFRAIVRLGFLQRADAIEAARHRGPG